MVFELKPRGEATVPNVGVVGATDGVLAARPALCAHLLNGTYADGRPRKTSTLLVFLHEGSLKACLRDRNGDETAWVSADSFTGLLDALEAGLQEGKLDWRKEGRRGKR